MRLGSFCRLGALAGLLVGHVAASFDGVEHIVVLMLENRSFGHMLGFVDQNYSNRTKSEQIHGVNTDMTNSWDVNDPTKGSVNVTYGSPYIASEGGPCHSVSCVTFQVFGAESQTSADPAPMNGFVQNEANHDGNDYAAAETMEAFTPDQVPAISTLAQEFALASEWYASIPGPTEVNRLYFYSGTSAGMVSTDDHDFEIGVDNFPLWAQLYEANVSSRIYIEDAATTFLLDDMRVPPLLDNFRLITDFIEDAKKGELPQFSFIEPTYFSLSTSLFTILANDEHPAHSVVEGEKLIAEIYSHLRNGPLWNKTALIVTYDEHGGYFDPMPTPLDGVPNPDGLTNSEFNFTRLGVRIPTIIASPLIERETVLTRGNGPTDTSQFDHTSVAATLKLKYGLQGDLSERSKWASTFENIFSLDTPRTDCPTSLPLPSYSTESTESERRERGRVETDQELDDMHRGLVTMAARMAGCPKDAQLVKTELHASLFTRDRLGKHLGLDMMKRVRELAKGERFVDGIDLHNPFPSLCERDDSAARSRE